MTLSQEDVDEVVTILNQLQDMSDYDEMITSPPRKYVMYQDELDRLYNLLLQPNVYKHRRK